MCSELWMMTAFQPQEAAVVPRLLARTVRHGLQLQLKRKEQINRMLRRGLNSTRRQLHLKKIQVVTSLTSKPLNMFTSRNKPVGKSGFYSTSWGSTSCWVRRWRRRWKNSSRTRMKLLSTCTSRYLQKHQDAQLFSTFRPENRPVHQKWCLKSLWPTTCLPGAAAEERRGTVYSEGKNPAVWEGGG